MKAKLVFLSLILSAALVRSQTRDPWLWPFDKESIWNMPIHENADYSDANISAAAYVGFDVQHFLRLKTSDPSRDVHSNNGWTNRCSSTGDQGYDLHIPDGWIVHPDGSGPYGNTPNATFAFLKPDSDKMIQGQVMARCDGRGNIYYPSWINPNVNESILGDGLNGNGGHGHGASGMSAIGGALREGELTGSEPIRHALTLTIDAAEYCYYSQSLPGYQWPAKSADNYAPEDYGGTNPDFVMGTLLAIPPSVAKGNLGLESTAGSKLFDAFRDYGAYVVEASGWDCHYLCAEEQVVLNDMGGAENHVVSSGAFFRDVNRLFEKLSIVTNNRSGNIGGGPTSDHSNRLAPMACDLGTIGSGAMCGGGGDTDPPAAPSGLSATGNDGSVRLNWDDNSESDLEGYEVYRSTVSGGDYSPIGSSAASSADYTDSDVSNGTTYYYVVTAEDNSGNESSYSGEASATPGSTASDATLTVRARVTGGSSDNLELRLDDNTVKTWTISGSSFADYSHPFSGEHNVKLYFPDNGTDMEIDYITIGSCTCEAEDQATNTAVYQDGSCGGSYSQEMHCAGYIDFGTVGECGAVALSFVGDGAEKAYPNRAGKVLGMELNDLEDIRVFNALGELVYRSRGVRGNAAMRAFGTTRGLYLIRAADHGVIHIRRVVVNE